MDDLTFVSLRAATVDEMKAQNIRPPFNVLVLDFSTRADLRAMLKKKHWSDAYIFSDLCPESRDGDYFIGISDVLENGASLLQSLPAATTSAPDGLRLYRALIRYGVRTHRGNDRSLDESLPPTPQDLCFWLDPSGYSRTTFSSNTAVVPKEALAAALAGLPR